MRYKRVEVLSSSTARLGDWWPHITPSAESDKSLPVTFTTPSTTLVCRLDGRFTLLAQYQRFRTNSATLTVIHEWNNEVYEELSFLVTTFLSLTCDIILIIHLNNEATNNVNCNNGSVNFQPMPHTTYFTVLL